LSLLFPLPFWTLLLLLLHTRLASSSPLHLLISALLHCLSLSQRLTIKRKEAQCRSEFSEDQERNVVFFFDSLSLSLAVLFLSQELLLQKL
jgi:hypothetical protein